MPVEKIPVAKAEQDTILLTGEGQLHARVDCNRDGGAYEDVRAIAAGLITSGVHSARSDGFSATFQ